MQSSYNMVQYNVPLHTAEYKERSEWLGLTAFPGTTKKEFRLDSGDQFNITSMA